MINLMKKIEDYTNNEDFKLSDIIALEKELKENGFDTCDIHELIRSLKGHYKDFMRDMDKEFKELTDDQIETIEVLKRNNIKFEVKKEHDWFTQKEVYKIEIDFDNNKNLNKYTTLDNTGMTIENDKFYLHVNRDNIKAFNKEDINLADDILEVYNNPFKVCSKCEEKAIMDDMLKANDMLVKTDIIKPIVKRLDDYIVIIGEKYTDEQLAKVMDYTFMNSDDMELKLLAGEWILKKVLDKEIEK